MRLHASTTAAFAFSLSLASAQTSTSCNPTKKSCSSDLGLDSTSYNADFTQGSSAANSWSTADGTTIEYGSDGAEFTISKAGQAPTIETDFYFFFGRCDVVMKAAPGQGIVSSIVLESDDLDEVDWEFVGGDQANVQSNYFGKGNTSTYDRATYIAVSDPMSEWHTYTLDWTSEKLEWIIDGVTVRTLAYEDANGGDNFPQTPMQLKLGNWAGGGPDQPEGTVEWAGGETDFTQGPFTMYVKSVSITNYNPASEYKYGDRSGSWESIDILNGTSSGSSSSASTTTAAASQQTHTADVDTSTATVAPTSSHVVDNVANTQVAVSVTKIASSVIADETASVSGDSNEASTTTSLVQATSMVPTGQGNGTDIATGPVGSGTATSSGGLAMQTDSGAASVEAFGMGGLIGVVVAAFML